METIFFGRFNWGVTLDFVYNLRSWLHTLGYFR